MKFDTTQRTPFDADRLEQADQLLALFCRGLWEQAGEETQRTHVRSALQLLRKPASTKSQRLRRQQAARDALYPCCSRLHAVFSGKWNAAKFRSIVEDTPAVPPVINGIHGHPHTHYREQNIRYEWLWESCWQDSLFRFIRLVLEEEFGNSPLDAGQEDLFGELKKLCQENFRQLKTEEVKREIMRHWQEMEYRDSVYRSWWREMLAEYKRSTALK